LKFVAHIRELHGGQADIFTGIIGKGQGIEKTARKVVNGHSHGNDHKNDKNGEPTKNAEQKLHD
jgi:hypothetical protein